MSKRTCHGNDWLLGVECSLIAVVMPCVMARVFLTEEWYAQT